jgi:hypothetical protein
MKTYLIAGFLWGVAVTGLAFVVLSILLHGW